MQLPRQHEGLQLHEPFQALILWHPALRLERGFEIPRGKTCRQGQCSGPDVWQVFTSMTRLKLVCLC